MRSLVIGLGEIGSAVTQTISRGTDTVLGYDVNDGAAPTLNDIDILHICFPFHDEAAFLASVGLYIKQYKPMHVLIWSTVPIGTTKQIHGAVHTPVEGRHPRLALSVRSMMRWIGTNNQGEGEFFAGYFKELWMKTHVVSSSDYTEFLKLRSTSRYGVNLAFAEYEARTAEAIGMDYKLLKDFDKDYNKLYHNLSMPWAQRYVLNDPAGKIGGHCVVPNAKLLDKQFPCEMLKMIIAMEVKT